MPGDLPEPAPAKSSAACSAARDTGHARGIRAILSRAVEAKVREELAERKVRKELAERTVREELTARKELKYLEEREARERYENDTRYARNSQNASLPRCWLQPTLMRFPPIFYCPSRLMGPYSDFSTCPLCLHEAQERRRALLPGNTKPESDA